MAKGGKKIFTMQVGEEMLARWKARAALSGVSLAALVIERMEALEPTLQEAFTAAIKPHADKMDRLASLRSDPANRIIDPKVSHPVGPVLADPVPRAATGQAVGFNPKSSWKTEQAKGKGKR